MEACTVLSTTLTTIEPLPATLAPLPAEGLTAMISSSCSALTFTDSAVRLPFAPMPATAWLSVIWMLRPAPTAPPSLLVVPNKASKLPATANCSSWLSATTCNGADHSQPSVRRASRRLSSAAVLSSSGSTAASKLDQATSSLEVAVRLTLSPAHARVSIRFCRIDSEPAMPSLSASPVEFAYWVAILPTTA